MKSKNRNRKQTLNSNDIGNKTPVLNTITVENPNYKVILPQDIKVGFQDLFGHKECRNELQNLLQFLKDPSLYHEFNVQPHTKYLLTGPAGIGKKTLVCAVAREANLPIIIIEPTFFCGDIDEFDDELLQLFTKAATLMAMHGNCVLLFKNIEYWMSEETDIAMFFVEKLLGYFKNLPALIAFATLGTGIVIPRVFLENHGFTKTIGLQGPDVNIRKEVLTHFLTSAPLEENLDLQKLAVDTFSMSIKDLKNFVRETKLYALKTQSEVITYRHFAEVLAETEFGYKNRTLTAEMRLSTARHEAGHVIADYFSDPANCKISKVDITPRAYYGGVTLFNIEEEKGSFFKEDLENEIISSFGGMAAEQIYYNSTSTGVSNDIEQATKVAIGYFKLYGMSKEFGPICLEEGTLSSPILDVEADKAIRDFLKEHYNKTVKILQEHFDVMEKLVNVLLEKEVLYREEILEILNS